MSDDARALYAPPEPRDDSEASRLERQAPRWCASCGWGSHHTDRCKEDELATPADVEENLAEARSALRASSRTVEETE